MHDNHAITVRVDSQKSELLNLLSEEYKRSKNFLINEALEKYLEEEIFHLEQLQASIKQADNGEIVDNDKAKEEIEQLFESINME